ncbi:hypothetical protein GF382_01985 [Candidatus Falkowbacteria bacterium]|nr:hypothetical protein [Candidatus Falkowbacteria bacterium]
MTVRDELTHTDLHIYWVIFGVSKCPINFDVKIFLYGQRCIRAGEILECNFLEPDPATPNYILDLKRVMVAEIIGNKVYVVPDPKTYSEAA